jgi:hypothetical protein
MFWCDYGVHEAFLALCLYGTEHSKHIGNSLKSVMNFWVDTFPEVYTTVWVTCVGTVGKVVSCLPSIAVYPQSVEVKAIKTDVMLIITSVNFWISSSCSKLLIYLWSCFHCHWWLPMRVLTHQVFQTLSTFFWPMSGGNNTVLSITESKEEKTFLNMFLSYRCT